MKREKGGGVGTHFKFESTNCLMHVNDISVLSTMSVFRSDRLDSEHDAT